MLQRSANLLHMRTMHADRLMQLIARHTKLLRPVMNIGRHLRINLLRIMRAFLRLDVLRMRGTCFRLLNFFMLVRPCRILMRHIFIPLFVFLKLDAEVMTEADLGEMICDFSGEL